MKLHLNQYHTSVNRFKFRKFFCLIAVILLSYSCLLPLKKKAVSGNKKVVSGIIRDFHTNSIIPNSRVYVPKQKKEFSTDLLGYFEIPNKKQNLGKGDVLIVKSSSGNDTVSISSNLKFYKIFIKRQPGPNQATDKPRIADMHYHVSMKSHNEFGLELYNIEKRLHKKFLFIKSHNFVYNNKNTIDNHLLWLTRYKHAKVLYEGKYKRYGKIKPVYSTTTKRKKKKYEKLNALYEGKWLSPRKKKSNNNLYHYTQATLPHLRDGNVKLAFNAISPFEFNLNNNGKIRFISRVFKSNGERKWLKTIGGTYGKDPDFSLTHWQNYQNELALMKGQDIKFNSFGWEYLKYGNQLDTDKNTNFIVNVVEGAHILQDKAFMNYIYFNEREKERLRKDQLEKLNTEKIQATLLLYNASPDYVKNSKLNEQYSKLQNQNDTIKNLNDNERSEASVNADVLLNSLVMEELRRNIRELKSDSLFPIFMVTISHLSWNGMTSHAPSLDTKGIGRPLIKRLYRIKAGDDKAILKQWKSLFYSESSVNTFGKTLINDLISQENNERRVLVDLKHSDYPTRRYFYDSVMTPKKVPPICSHCAVTGLKEYYYSPFVDEYSLLKSSADSIFYPFGINLYDEEIVRICTNNGIIGITLEQRVLGGLIRRKRKVKIEAEIEKLRENNEYNSFFKAIEEYNTNAKLMNIPPKKSDKIFLKDYLSTDPFMQNLFHILDHSGKAGKEAWKHICIGSDLDGIIDPIDVCPTASQYPHFKERLKQFIPLFLAIRKVNNSKANDYDFYFNNPGHPIKLDEALDALFYNSLEDFVKINFKR